MSPTPGTRQYVWNWWTRRCDHWNHDDYHGEHCYRQLWPWYWAIRNVGPYPSHPKPCPARGAVYRSWWRIGPLEVRTWGRVVGDCTCPRDWA